MHQERFDFAAPGTTASELPPRDPNIDAEDRPRLSQQCVEVLAMLRAHREVANYQMAQAGILKYTGRISDLRKHGYVIKVVRREGGTRWYRLIEEDTP